MNKHEFLGIVCVSNNYLPGDQGEGSHQTSPQYDDKNMLGNIGDLFEKCMRQVTKGHLYHLLGVSDYYVM